MKKYFRECFFYNRGQRLGILILSLLIIIIAGMDIVYSRYRKEHSLSADSMALSPNMSKEFQAFLKETTAPHKVLKSGNFTSKTTSRRFTFNPNTTDSATFRQLGLPPWIIRNILRYRAKGGRFRKAEDFSRVYGLSDSCYASLQPYIYIPTDTATESLSRKPISLLTKACDSVQPNHMEKYAPGTVLELNSADTTELKKIPGIGSALAKKIVTYRKQLGGFYQLKQLEEINLNYQLLLPWLRVDSTRMERIPVNRASVSRLNRHPYLNFYQAKALVEYRKKKGNIHNLKPFTLMEEFTAQDFERISHYLDFSE